MVNYECGFNQSETGNFPSRGSFVDSPPTPVEFPFFLEGFFFYINDISKFK